MSKVVSSFVGAEVCALLLASCLESRTEPEPSRDERESSIPSSNEPAGDVREDSRGTVRIIPDSGFEPEAFLSSVRISDNGDMHVEIARSFSRPLDPSSVAEYQGRILEPDDLFTTIELTIPAGTQFPVTVVNDTLPAGFRLNWVHAMSPADPTDSLCVGEPGGQVCGHRWIDEVVDEDHPAILNLFVAEIGLTPGSRVDLQIELSAFEFHDAAGQSNFCCSRSIEVDLDAVIDSDGRYPLSTAVWPLSISCGYQDLIHARDECAD